MLLIAVLNFLMGVNFYVNIVLRLKLNGVFINFADEFYILDLFLSFSGGNTTY